MRGAKDKKKHTIQTQEKLVGEGGQQTKEKHHTDTEKKLVDEGANRQKQKYHTFNLSQHKQA